MMEFHHRFSLNVWAGVFGNALIGLFVIPPRINSAPYLQFLQNDLLDDVPICQEIYFFST